MFQMERTPELRQAMRRVWFMLFFTGPALLLAFKLFGVLGTVTQLVTGAALAICITIALAAHYVVLSLTGEG